MKTVSVDNRNWQRLHKIKSEFKQYKYMNEIVEQLLDLFDSWREGTLPKYKEWHINDRWARRCHWTPMETGEGTQERESITQGARRWNWYRHQSSLSRNKSTGWKKTTSTSLPPSGISLTDNCEGRTWSSRRNWRPTIATSATMRCAISRQITRVHNAKSKDSSHPPCATRRWRDESDFGYCQTPMLFSIQFFSCTEWCWNS